jgi:hypothetical protein
MIERASRENCDGSGPWTNLVDTVYIDNAAECTCPGCRKTVAGSPVAGKAYFITNGQPMPLWDLIDPCWFVPACRRTDAKCRTLGLHCAVDP